MRLGEFRVFPGGEPLRSWIRDAHTGASQGPAERDEGALQRDPRAPGTDSERGGDLLDGPVLVIAVDHDRTLPGRKRRDARRQAAEDELGFRIASRVSG